MTIGVPIGQTWKERLGLASRRAPEFYESAEAVVDTPHALAIRTALNELGLGGVFCIQGVPTIAILSLDQFNPKGGRRYSRCSLEPRAREFAPSDCGRYLARLFLS